MFNLILALCHAALLGAFVTLFRYQAKEERWSIAAYALFSLLMTVTLAVSALGKLS